MKVELDLENAELYAGTMGIVARLRKVVETGETHGLANTRDIIADIADQIEAQLPKPKPEEPTGLGAVVEDARGELYVGLGTHFANGKMRWQSRRCVFTTYDRISAVRVLSEGVSL